MRCPTLRVHFAIVRHRCRPTQLFIVRLGVQVVRRHNVSPTPRPVRAESSALRPVAPELLAIVVVAPWVCIVGVPVLHQSNRFARRVLNSAVSRIQHAVVWHRGKTAQLCVECSCVDAAHRQDERARTGAVRAECVAFRPIVPKLLTIVVVATWVRVVGASVLHQSNNFARRVLNSATRWIRDTIPRNCGRSTQLVVECFGLHVVKWDHERPRSGSVGAESAAVRPVAPKLLTSIVVTPGIRGLSAAVFHQGY